jgi:ribonuclease HI
MVLQRGIRGRGDMELFLNSKNTEKKFRKVLGVIAGLEALKEPGQTVAIYSDSKYVVDSVEKGWIWGWVKKNFKDKKNEDLWRRFIKVYQKHKVKFHWLKGHAGNIENEVCDQLAVKSAEGPNLKIDHGYEEQ